jgi:hypothetical protein
MSVQAALRSSLVWRLTGLTYPTAIIATNGRLLTVTDYISYCRRQVNLVREHVVGYSNALDFGTGLGGNLIALAGLVDSGVGVDINPLYLRLARFIARRQGFQQFSFQSYDGEILPFWDPKPDLLLSFGVFERIPKVHVARYLDQLVARASERARMVFTFLSETAASTEFTTRLGREAYVFWTPSEVESIARRVGLRTRTVVPIGLYRRTDRSGFETVAGAYVFDKRE